MKSSRVSVIIPVWNEAEHIEQCLASFRGQACELILVDGGSEDETVALAEKSGVRIIRRHRANRGQQMNVGARVASGEYLLFFHADSRLPVGGIAAIEAALADPAVVGGAFQLAFFPPTQFYRFLASGANLFCWATRMLFGDRGIFLRAKDFWQWGGYVESAIMEDAMLADRMRRQGQLALLPLTVYTSARKYANETKLQAVYRTMWAYAAYRLGVSPERIRAGYYGLDRRSGAKRSGSRRPGASEGEG